MQFLFFVLMGFTSINFNVFIICLLLVSQNSSAQNIDSLSNISISKADYFLKLSNSYKSQGQISNVLDYGKQGLALSKERDSIRVELLNTLGDTYIINAQSSKSTALFIEAVTIAKEIENNRLLAISLSNLATSYKNNGELNKALQFEIESSKLFVSLKDSVNSAQTLENVGGIYEDEEKFDLAKMYFLESQKFQSDTLTYEYANVLNNIGDAYRKEGDSELGIEYATRALNIGKQIKSIEQIESAYKDLSRGHAQITLQEAESTRKILIILLSILSFIGLGALLLWLNKKRKDEATIKKYEQEALKNQLAQKEAEEKSLQNEIRLKKLEQEALQNELATREAKESALRNEIRLKQLEQEALQSQLTKKQVEETALQNEVKLKTASLSNYSLHISQKNKMLLDLSESLKKIKDRKGMDSTKTINSLIKEIESHLGEQNEWEEFVNLFNEIHPDFMNKVSNSTNNKLSSSELRLAVLLRLNMSSKEIASILRITPDSVRVARYRLRKKLPISSGEDLVQYFIDL